MGIWTIERSEEYLAHHGIKGQKWGIRRYQNDDGTLTEEGKIRYGVDEIKPNRPKPDSYRKDLMRDLENYNNELIKNEKENKNLINRKNGKKLIDEKYSKITKNLYIDIVSMETLWGIGQHWVVNSYVKNGILYKDSSKNNKN